MSDRPRPQNLKWRNLINHYQSLLDDLRIQLIKDGRSGEDAKVVASMAREALLGSTRDEEMSDKLLLPYFRECAERRRNESYRDSCQYTIKKVEEFDDSAMTIDDITLKWLRDFDEWLEESGASQNTRAIHFKNIRAVMNRANDDELTSNYPFRRFKIKRQWQGHGLRTSEGQRFLTPPSRLNEVIFAKSALSFFAQLFSFSSPVSKKNLF